MMWPVVAAICIVGFLVGSWAFFAWRHRPPKPPEPTPWADSTKVAQEVREMEVADDGCG